jgi:signal transduction histidine kinase
MRSQEKLFRRALLRLTLGIMLLFPLINIGYFTGLAGLVHIFPDSVVTKTLCSINEPNVINTSRGKRAIVGLTDSCISTDFWRSFLILGSLLVILVVINLMYVRLILKPIRFAHHAQRQFSSSALHQMQTPLSVMRSHIDNAKINNHNESNELLDSLTDELLTLEKTTKSLVQLSKPTVTQYTSIKDIQKSLQILSNAHKINSFLISKKVALVPMSHEDIYMILDIALGNIVKHTRVHEAHIVIERRFRKINMSIKDNGVSFKKLKHKQLEDLQSVGHGIGLNIITIITHKYGGTLKIKKKPHTTLSISLPKK